ncbi:MAG TPA: response regulator [Halalkalibaculum sp.]|nr:response regulator [Halalkalibaculum sp.]
MAAVVEESSKGVLIVEDELIIALMIERMVQNLGHKVLAKVTSGEAAIVAAKEHRPDIILMDIRLQGEMDGIDAMSVIRRTSNIPVIFITGNSDENYRKRVEEADPLGFLTKPITQGDLSRSFSCAS